MYISKTPLRIGLFGGGTDFQYFFKNNNSNVINFTINKFCYVSIKRHDDICFEEKFRLNYSLIETVKKIEHIKNKIVKNTLKYKKVKSPLYISTISDVPAGTGLGSSGAFSVGLLNALNQLNCEKNNKYKNAVEASHIEINLCKLNSGYQDQFAASFGGFNHFNFNKSNVKINNLKKYKYIIKYICERSLLLWTGINRNSNQILFKQKKNLNKNLDSLKKLNEISENFLANIKNFSYSNFLNLLNKSSKIKYDLEKNIMNNEIKKIIPRNNKDILASKLLGAGGGGFILICFKNKEKKNKFLSQNKNCLEFGISEEGTQIFKI